MSNDEFLLQNEIDEITKIEVDNIMVEKVKKNSNEVLRKILLDDIFKKIKGNFDADEEIDFYFIGRDYTSDSLKLIFASTLFASSITHPIFGWSSQCILIKTNKRLLLAEITSQLQYTNHYEVKNEIHLVKEKDFFYLIIETVDGAKKILQHHIQNFETIMELLKDNVTIIYDKTLKSKARTTIKIIYIIQISFVLFVLYFLITHWSNLPELYSLKD